MFGIIAVCLILACCAHSETIRTFFAVALFLLTILMIVGVGVMFG